MNESAGGFAGLDSPATVATTSTVPVPGGTTAVQDVLDAHTTSVAGLPAPKANDVPVEAVENPVPWMVTESPATPVRFDVTLSMTLVTVG